MRRRGKLSSGAAVLTAAVTVGAILLVTACAGGGSMVGAGVGAGSDGRCPTAAGVSQRQLTFGLVYPSSGASAASLSPYRAGVDARLGVANAHGGVYGRTVGYTWADDAGQAASNLAAAQQMVAGRRVFAVQEFSLTPKGSAALFNREGIPVVGTSNDPVWNQYPNMFSSLNFVSDSAGTVSTWGDYALSQGATKAAILYSQLAGGSQLVGAKFRASLEAAHIPTRMIEVESASLDVPAVVRQIRASGADFLTGFLDGSAFFSVAAAASQAIPGIKIMSPFGYDPALLALGKELAGMSVLVGYTPFERPVPAEKVFLDAISQYAPQLQPSANEIALTGWIDTDLLLRGLQAAGPCPTRQSFITKLRDVSNYDADGLLAAPVDMRTIRDEPTACYWFVKIGPAGDRFVTVGDQPRCGRQLR